MEYKMKILDKYIDPIKNSIKTKEYRLYDDLRKKIKMGDTILFVSNTNKNRYIRVKVNGIKVFPSWEDALKENLAEILSFTILSYEESLKEFYSYYKIDEVKENGIVSFDIEPVIHTFKNARVLIDTNTIIYRESHQEVNFEVAELYKWFDKLKMTKLIHPATKDEINKYGNSKLKNSIISKLNSYQEIVPINSEDNFYKRVINKYPKDPNSIIDNSILLQVYLGISDYLVTNDKSLIRKANELYLEEKVFSVSVFLKNIEDEHPSLIDYDMLSVRLKKFGEVNHEDSFFDSLREDYQSFNNWFMRKNNDYAYVFEEQKSLKGFLYLKIEDITENYDDIEPKLEPKKRLKIGTFKIIRSGFRLGERFLKIIFDNAIKNNVDEIYVTMFEDKSEEINQLRDFLMKWGFIKHGYKKSNSELVLVKDMRFYDENKSPMFNFPLIKENPDYYFLPIFNQYHTDLFPDFILKNENMNLYGDNLAHRYSIEKIYISGAYGKPNPGDIVLIYRTGERSPKKYSSVVTGLVIIQEIAKPKSLEEYLKICSNKSVFSEKELKEFYNNKRWRTVIKLLNYEAFDKKIILDKLQKMNIIEINSGPRSFDKISNEDYDKILKESKA